MSIPVAVSVASDSSPIAATAISSSVSKLQIALRHVAPRGKGARGNAPMKIRVNANQAAGLTVRVSPAARKKARGKNSRVRLKASITKPGAIIISLGRLSAGRYTGEIEAQTANGQREVRKTTIRVTGRSPSSKGKRKK